ncbi:MAG: phage head-tail joining protein [Rickettsiales bacterium]|nr:MAG: phage head-tail joining protein [Rickettsiales bacterium]
MKQNIISKLSHRIIFLENRAASELEEDLWEEVQTSFAEMKPICDNRFVSLEGLQFGNVITEGYFLFRIRSIKDVHSRMRINFQGRLFEIKRIIDEDEKGRMLSIVALEI